MERENDVAEMVKRLREAADRLNKATDGYPTSVPTIGMLLAEAAALLAKLGQAWIPVSERQAPPHTKYLLRRDGMIFTATPCYGMHNPWWVVRTLTGEAEPTETRPTDEWMPLPPTPGASDD